MSSNDTVHHRETLAGDPFAWAGRRLEEAAAGVPERRTEAELVEAIREEEARLGREMTYGERVSFAYGFHAPSYRADLRRLMAAGVAEIEEDEE